MRGFWRRLRTPAVVPAGLGWAGDGRLGEPAAPTQADHQLRASRAPATIAELDVSTPDATVVAQPRCLPSPILVQLPDPAARRALEVALRTEEVLATVAVAVDLLQARMGDLEARLVTVEASEVDADDTDADEAPTVADLQVLRAQTARVAAELARLNIELRADLAAVAERVRPGSTPTVAATVAARRPGNANGTGARTDAAAPERIVDLRTWVGPDPAALKPEPQAWAKRP